jgi:1,2-diacylglycerol 3-alpha-glucosyltransferase
MLNMKIGMLVDRYKPYISGVTNSVSLNKQFLEKLGHQVYVLTFGDDDYQDNEPNVIRSSGISLADTGVALGLRYSPEARCIINTLDIAHIHHPFLSGSLALRFFKPRGIPLVFTNHTRYDLYAQAYLPMLPETVGETAMKAFLPFFCRSVDAVIAPSEGMARVLEHFGVNASIQVIPNGVDLKPFQNPGHPLARAAFGIQEEDVVFIYVGRLGPEKNLNFLIRSFSGSAHALSNIHLFIVGDGPERDNLEYQAQQTGVNNRLHFTGSVSYPEIPDYLSMADAFVTASITEVHPLTVIEAMARGLPVLGVDSPGVGDTVQDGINGFLSSNDQAQFTAKMMLLASDAKLRHFMGNNARQHVNLYDINRIIKLTLELYDRLVTNTRGKKASPRARFIRFIDRWR